MEKGKTGTVDAGSRHNVGSRLVEATTMLSVNQDDVEI